MAPPEDPKNSFSGGKKYKAIAPKAVSQSSELPFSDYNFLSLRGIDRLKPHDINQLETKGCFKVPKHSILLELIRTYLLYTHAEIAIFHEIQLWELLQKPRAATGGGEPTLSLFVLYAMLSSACGVRRLLRVIEDSLRKHSSSHQKTLLSWQGMKIVSLPWLLSMNELK